MLDRNNKIAALAFALLTVAVVLSYRAPRRGERTNERPRPVPRLQKAAITKVTLSAKGKQVTLQRSKKKWVLVSPTRYAADTYATETMERKLSELDFGDVITTKKQRHDAFEVSAAKGVRVEVFGETAKLADFYLGKVESGFTFFRKEGDDTVYQAVGYLRSAFEKEARLWRDRNVLKVDRDSVVKLQVLSPEGAVVLTRKDKTSPWTVETSPLPLPKLDTDVIKRLLGAASALSAHDFADGISEAQSGLNQPATRIVLRLAGGAEHELRISATKGKDDRYVQRKGQPQVFVLKEYAVKGLLVRPLDLKDKTILSLTPSDITALSLRKTGTGSNPAELVEFQRGADGKGWTSGAKAQRGVAKIDAAVAGFAGLKAVRFATKAPTELGLDKPAWTVTATLKGGQKVELSVGTLEKDGAQPVQLHGSTDLYFVQKRVLEAILLEPKHYK